MKAKNEEMAEARDKALEKKEAGGANSVIAW